MKTRKVEQTEHVVCPVCKSDNYLNPQMKLLVSPCFHKMCNNCIDRIFISGPAPCPICGVVLRKNQFMSQTFEDLQVEKEVQTRKRLAKIFNKRQEDFPTLKAYNDYLEEVEVITFNLINGIDVQDTMSKMEQYEKENQDLIRKNETRRMNEERLLKYQEEQERLEKQQSFEAYRREIEEERMAKTAERLEIIRELATSDRPADAIIAQRQQQAIQLKRSSMRKQQQQQQQEQSKAKIDSYLLSLQQRETMEEEEEEELDPDWDPVQSPYAEVQGYEFKGAYDDPRLAGYATKRMARAGGFTVRSVFERALQAAFVDLFVAPVESGSSPTS
ncbi:uncharacterized protein VTP21DRAFT_8239 [Calcarisporiella thermophila]|uniref:uncharacterized protein n=1 Tax=Calcarisporiella thermophila TaxID=911321 RepID=UPI003742FA5D